MKYKIIIYILFFFQSIYAEHIFYDKNNTRYLKKYNKVEFFPL